MAYEYISKGQKLHPKCKNCNKEIVLDVDKAKNNDDITIVCNNCKTENTFNAKKLLGDLDKQIREHLRKTFGESFNLVGRLEQ